MAKSLCCNCINFNKKEQNGESCYGYCKAKEGFIASMVCNSCKDSKKECVKFEKKSDKEDYYNGIHCLNNINNFFAFHDFLSHYETFCIGNIIKYLWRYKNKNGVKDLQKAKQYLEFLIDYQKGEWNSNVN